MRQPGGEGSEGSTDTCVCLAESLCCPPETTVTLLIGYTLRPRGKGLEAQAHRPYPEASALRWRVRAPSPTLWPLTRILAHLEEDGLPISTASWSGGSSSPPALAPGTPLFQQVPANIPSPASPPDLRWNLQWTIALHSEPMRPGTGPGAAGLGLPLLGPGCSPPKAENRCPGPDARGRPGPPMSTCHWSIPYSQGLPGSGEGLSDGCRVGRTHIHSLLRASQALEDRCPGTVQTGWGSAGGQPPCGGISLRGLADATLVLFFKCHLVTL